MQYFEVREFSHGTMQNKPCGPGKPQTHPPACSLRVIVQDSRRMTL
jgi:hypothetical protein